jgi:hypothetical protein
MFSSFMMVSALIVYTSSMGVMTEATVLLATSDTSEGGRGVSVRDGGAEGKGGHGKKGIHTR